MLCVLSSASNGTGVSSGLIVGIVIGSIVSLLISAWLLYRIGKKLGYPRPWYAFIPFLFVYMMVELSDQDKGWFWIIIICYFTVCLSLVSAILLIIVIMDISEKCGKPRWWALLWLIPFVIWIVMYITGSGEAPPSSQYAPAAPSEHTTQLPPQK